MAKSSGSGEWLWLWFHGWRDGRRRIPAPPADKKSFQTPQIEAIFRDAQAECESEDHRKVTYIANKHVRREELRRALPPAQAAVAAAEERVSRAVAAGRRTGRRTGEELLDEAVVTRRRQREHDRELDALRSEVTARQDALRAVESELASIPQAIERREQQAEHEKARIGRDAQRRMALYWRALLRAHRNRSRFTAADGPAWAEQGGLG
jgi:hypothetical protein